MPRYVRRVSRARNGRFISCGRSTRTRRNSRRRVTRTRRVQIGRSRRGVLHSGRFQMNDQNVYERPFVRRGIRKVDQYKHDYPVVVHREVEQTPMYAPGMGRVIPFPVWDGAFDDPHLFQLAGDTGGEL